MRTIALLLISLLFIGCKPSDSNQNDESASQRTANTDSTSTANSTGKDLHSDAIIESLVDYEITSLHGGIGPENPTLDVVPSGESHTRAEVFRKLDLDESKLRNFRTTGENMVDFLTWQVSPSYDITCMSANNDIENDGLSMDDPSRKVYGVRLSLTPK